MISTRHLRGFFLWRWAITAGMLIRGVRCHPGAMLIGSLKRFHFGRGTTVGVHSKLRCEPSGMIKTAAGVWIAADVEMETATGITIGAATTIQRRCTINGTVSIGAQCIFAPNVFVSSGTHPFRTPPWLPIREQERQIKLATGSLDSLQRPVMIQDDCWLGINVVVCPGVKIGKGSVVGANSVVVSDIPPYCVYAGAPAKLVSKRLDWMPPRQIDTSRDEDLPYILSGLTIRSSQVNGTQVSNDVPLEAVLSFSGTEQALNIEIEAQSSGRIAVLGQERTVSKGLNRLAVDISGYAGENPKLLVVNLYLLEFAEDGFLVVKKLYYAE